MGRIFRIILLSVAQVIGLSLTSVAPAALASARPAVRGIVYSESDDQSLPLTKVNPAARI